MLKVTDTESGKEYEIETGVQQRIPKGQSFICLSGKHLDEARTDTQGSYIPLKPIRRKIATQEDAVEWSRLNGNLLVSCSVGSRDPIRKACGYNYSASLATYSVQTSFNEWEKLTDLYVD